VGGKGSGGHNRKPTAVKKVQGNPGKRKLNKSEPRPRAGMPQMPHGMPAEAQAEWKRLTPILMKMGVLTVADGPALAAYCKLHAQVLMAEAAIKKYGIIDAHFDDDTGVAVLKKNPAVSIKAESLRLMKAFLLEFGLTPASRSKLTITEGRDLQPDVKAQDQLQDFLDRKPASESTQ
jgi:P27 family predicted phage terminase small subunit